MQQSAVERSLRAAPAHRRPPRFAAGQTWRYAVARLAELSDEALDPWGKEGWELVTVVGPDGDLRAVFKQPAR